jgi:hypothetical protein
LQVAPPVWGINDFGQSAALSAEGFESPSQPSGCTTQTSRMTETTVATPNAEAELPEGWLRVKSLDLEAQGVAHRPDGKVVFIDGALPFEVVSAKIHRSKSSFEKGTLTEIHSESSQRVVPGCVHFGLHEGSCGGCKMQHLHVGARYAPNPSPCCRRR